MLQGEYMLDFAHVFARALNNVANVGARTRNNVAHVGAHVGARTRNSRTFYVANVPAYGIAVCLFVCLSVCQYIRRLSVAVRRLSVTRGARPPRAYARRGVLLRPLVSMRVQYSISYYSYYHLLTGILRPASNAIINTSLTLTARERERSLTSWTSLSESARTIAQLSHSLERSGLAIIL
eukprot:scaffold368202_cov54-Attheya_sp.AAC.1